MYKCLVSLLNIFIENTKKLAEYYWNYLDYQFSGYMSIFQNLIVYKFIETIEK